MAKSKSKSKKEQEKKPKTNPEINNLIKGINSKFKKNVVNLGGAIKEDLIIKFIPTKSLKLNKALNGGIAIGRITEIYGPTGSGKTTLCYELVGKNMQEDPDSYWGWYETEKSFDPVAAESYGIDIDRLIYWEMDDEGAESGLDVLESIIRKGKGSVKGIIVNSVAGLTPKSELDSLMGKADVGTQAKMMSKLMRKITAIAGKNKMAVIFINQVRDKISLFGGTTTPGGRALAFFASQRFEMRKIKIEGSDGVDKTEFIKINNKIIKNRVARGNPYVETTLFGRYGQGTDIVMELLELAVNQNIIEKNNGGRYRYVTVAGEELKWHGAKNLMNYFDNNPDLRDEVIEKVNNEAIAVQQLSDEDMKKLEAYNNDTHKEITEALGEEEIAATEETGEINEA